MNYKSQSNKRYAACSVCGGDHNVIIIQLKDGRRRIIEPPLTEAKLAKLGLGVTEKGELL